MNNDNANVNAVELQMRRQANNLMTSLSTSIKYAVLTGKMDVLHSITQCGGKLMDHDYLPTINESHRTEKFVLTLVEHLEIFNPNQLQTLLEHAVTKFCSKKAVDVLLDAGVRPRFDIIHKIYLEYV